MTFEADFSVFVDKAVVELHKQGIFPKTKRHAAFLLYPKWKKISDYERSAIADITQLSKRDGQSAVGGEEGWLNHIGNAAVDDMGSLQPSGGNDDKLVRQRKLQRQYLLESWSGLCPSEIMNNILFYFVSFQSHFDFPYSSQFDFHFTSDFQPCEVSVKGYSLSGVTREFHALIDLGDEDPLAFDRVITVSRAINRIPTRRFRDGSRDYESVWKGILEFINPGFKNMDFPPLFSKISELDKNKACLDYLANLARGSNDLKIFQWEGLASTLYEVAGERPPAIDVITRGAESTEYDEEHHLKCKYHGWWECVYCAKFTVEKCGFWFEDKLAKIYNHIPMEVRYAVPEILRHGSTSPKRNSTTDAVTAWLSTSGHSPRMTDLAFRKAFAYPVSEQPRSLLSGHESLSQQQRPISPPDPDDDQFCLNRCCIFDMSRSRIGV